MMCLHWCAGVFIAGEEFIMRRLYSLILCIILFTFSVTGIAYADNYSVGFDNSAIQIRTPNTSDITCNGYLTIEGTSSLNEVWFCIRSPQQELKTDKAEVFGGRFKVVLNLQMGKGEYTIWAGDNPKRFDGSIRFTVQNQDSQDSRYTAPSVYVDYNDAEIQALAKSLAPEGLSDIEKLKNIHEWITANISYDVAAYNNGGGINMIPASQTILNRKGMCRDYSFLLAALARASGLPTRVIYGEASPDPAAKKGAHAWNEVMVNGEWVSVDSTWDAGYVTNSKFVTAPSQKFFALEPATLAITHKANKVELY
jgi:hypothetical protein